MLAYTKKDQNLRIRVKCHRRAWIGDIIKNAPFHLSKEVRSEALGVMTPNQRDCLDNKARFIFPTFLGKSWGRLQGKAPASHVCMR